MDLLKEVSALPEQEKFPEAKNLQEIIRTKENLKEAIEHQLFKPQVLLERIEEFYPYDMKARVRRLIDVLD